MKWYYLAFLICILEIIMIATIVLIPLVRYLRDYYDWFEKPFEMAFWES